LIISSTLLALTFLGSSAQDGAEPAPSISYQVRVLEMKGLDWRATLHPRMTPVARQGSAMVWSVSGDVAREVGKSADKVTAAPRVISGSDVPATIRVGQERAIVADFTRVADGPVDHATAVAFQPEVRHIDEFLKFSVSSRIIDQGMLANISLEDSHVSSIHTYTIKETVPDAKGDSPSEIKGQIQVPEMVSGRVEGEWLIPKDGALIVGLGAHTSANDQGKAEVRERLAVIEARPTAHRDPKVSQVRVMKMAPTPAAPHTAGVLTTPLPPLPPLPIGRSAMPFSANPVAGAVMPGLAMEKTRSPLMLTPAIPVAPASEMPVPPSRSLPVPRTADGSTVELPPLPTDDVIDDAAASAEPRPAPQTQARPNASARPAPATETKTENVSPSEKSIDLSGYMRALHGRDTPENSSPRSETFILGTMKFPASPRNAMEKEPLCRVDREECGLSTCETHALALTLKQAIDTSLANSKTIRIVEKACPDDPTSCTVIATDATSQSPQVLRKDLLAHLRAVEQQYWAVYSARVQFQASENAREIIEKFVEGEESKTTPSDPNLGDTKQQLERCRLDLVAKSSNLRTTERQLRKLIGLTAQDARSIVCLSNPCTDDPDVVALCCNFEHCPTTDSIEYVEPGKGFAILSSLKSKARELDRAREEVHSAHKLLPTATNIKKAATERMRAQKAHYENGAITSDRYAQAVRDWASAVGQDVEITCRYNTALACRDEVTGELFNRWNLRLAEPDDGETRDLRAARASFVPSAIRETARTLSLPLGPGMLRLEIRFHAIEKAPADDCETDCPARP
jgi:hypothetical protein